MLNVSFPHRPIVEFAISASLKCSIPLFPHCPSEFLDLRIAQGFNFSMPLSPNMSISQCHYRPHVNSQFPHRQSVKLSMSASPKCHCLNVRIAQVSISKRPHGPRVKLAFSASRNVPMSQCLQRPKCQRPHVRITQVLISQCPLYPIVSFSMSASQKR